MASYCALPELRAAARRVLLIEHPAAKVAAAIELAAAAERHPLAADAVVPAVALPGRPARPVLVAVRQLKPRGLGSAAGRASFLHAIAHIEFNAINLACDAIARFPAMPTDYYLDWARVAADEARHFQLLAQRLGELGHAYGDFPAHDGLWEMARRTAGDVLERMALVPRVLEARGLDVTPAMIDKLRMQGDLASVAVLEVILDEEVAHVEIGSRWFRWCCRQRGVDPLATFERLLAALAPGVIRAPFNWSARSQAGFDADERAVLERLAGATA